MKKFSFDTIRKQYKIATEAAQPAAFSGKYPTRISYRVKVVGRGETVDYCGKPNLDAYRRFQKLSRTKNVEWAFFEFDRKNVVSRVTHNKHDSIHRRLHQVYHPFSGGNPFYTFRQPWFRKKIAGFVAYYSPTKTLKKAQLDGHKEWLVTNGFVRSDKPEEQKKKLVKEKPVVKTTAAWFEGSCNLCAARVRRIFTWDGVHVPGRQWHRDVGNSNATPNPACSGGIVTWERPDGL